MVKLIGCETGRTEDLKDEYKPNYKCYGVDVRHNKRIKGVEVKITTLGLWIKQLWTGPRKRINKKIADNLEKDDGKPVDTSNWVKPDKESIQDALIVQLVIKHILKEDTEAWHIADAKVDVLYSILHSHSPNNSQSLTNYYLHSIIETIYRELGNKAKSKYCWELTNKVIKGKLKHNKYCKEVKKWRNNEWKKSITVVNETKSKPPVV